MLVICHLGQSKIIHCIPAFTGTISSSSSNVLLMLLWTDFAIWKGNVSSTAIFPVNSNCRGEHLLFVSDTQNTLKDWLTILHWHSTIHHKSEMHCRRGTETNFSTDCHLSRPQCNIASLYAVVWVRGVTAYAMCYHCCYNLSAKSYSWVHHAYPHSLVVVKRHLGKVRKSLTEVEADLCQLIAKLLLACTEHHSLMV